MFGLTTLTLLTLFRLLLPLVLVLLAGEIVRRRYPDWFAPRH